MHFVRVRPEAKRDQLMRLGNVAVQLQIGDQELNADASYAVGRGSISDKAKAPRSHRCNVWEIPSPPKPQARAGISGSLPSVNDLYCTWRSDSCLDPLALITPRASQSAPLIQSRRAVRRISTMRRRRHRADCQRNPPRQATSSSSGASTPQCRARPASASRSACLPRCASQTPRRSVRKHGLLADLPNRWRRPLRQCICALRSTRSPARRSTCLC